MTSQEGFPLSDPTRASMDDDDNNNGPTGTSRWLVVAVGGAAVAGSVVFYLLAEQLGMNGLVSVGIFLSILLFTVLTSRSKK